MNSNNASERRNDAFTFTDMIAARKVLDVIPRPADYVIEWNNEGLEYNDVPEVLKIDDSWFPKMSFLVSPDLHHLLRTTDMLKDVIGPGSFFGVGCYCTTESEREAAMLKLAPYLTLRRPLKGF